MVSASGEGALEFFNWFRKNEVALMARPWLLLGKGPSFSKVYDVDAQSYFLFGLNHVVRQVKVTIAHAIDIDVIESCQDVLEDNAEYVVLPWRPHVANKPGQLALSEHIAAMPVLQRLAAANRLFWYNAATAQVPAAGSPIVPVTYFSAEAGLNLLAMAGIKKVRSLGVDGGASYSDEFSSVGTLLANGRCSFNKQFSQIAKTIMRHNLDYAPLGVTAPARVFVATTDAQMLATMVLEYSIKKHASLSVDVFPLHKSGIDIPQPKKKENWPRTPFSFQRFLIPEVCDYQGRAIYLDSDMQVFTDIRELWETGFKGNALLSAQDAKEGGRKPQYSVMLLDCAALDWSVSDIVDRLDAGGLSYESLMHEMTVAPSQEALIRSEWNSLESYREGQTRLLHYTDMDTQPWIYARNPLGYLWCRDLFEAINEGHIAPSVLDEHISKGWVRPSLRYQFEHGIEDPLLLPRSAYAEDKEFLAPFLGIHQHTGSPWVSLRAAMLAFYRRLYFRTPLSRMQRRLKAWREKSE